VHGTVDVAATVARLDAHSAVDERPTVLAIHHPPSPPSTNPWFQLDGAAHLLDELRLRPHVRIVVSGHLHHAFEASAPVGPTLVGCPSTIMAIAHHGDDYEIGVAAPTGGRILTLGDDGSWSAELLVA
jgi:Icc protein